jgi:serine/threonine protein kinase
MKVVLGHGDPGKGETPPVDEKTLGRFVEEAQVTGQLDHPGIVPVHEIGVDAEGRVYFTMRLVQGDDLRAVFEQLRAGQGGWTQTRVLGVILKVCEAMAFAHAKGVIHRDLKPANIMVGRFGEAYVMDWGLARVLDREDERDIRVRAPPDERQPRADWRSARLWCVGAVRDPA